jgi:terminase, large subunit
MAPVSGTEWADRFFRLPAGSSQTQGAWTTHPLQVFILNAMCNRAISAVALQKSARVGYTKMLVAALFAMSHQHRWNSVVYQPTDDDGKDFVIDEVDGALADIPLMQSVFPYWNSNDQNNTVKKKVGNGVTIDIKGAATPKNFRRITKQVLIGDEVDAWDWEIGKEGSPIRLARKRLEGAAFPKEIWGTTPTNAGESHIEVLLAEMDLVFRFHLPCPHCGHEQELRWGNKDTPGGMRFDVNQGKREAIAATAHYQCEHCEGKIRYNQLRGMELAGRWVAEDGTWSRDGLAFFDADGNKVATPRRIGIHISALYSLNLTEGWVGLVKEWLDCGKDPVKLKTFFNLVLGLVWDGEDRNKVDWELLKGRREIWWQGERKANPVPDRAQILTGGMDTQDDRVEMFVWAWGPGEECWLVDHIVLQGDMASDEMKAAVKGQLYNQYQKRDGTHYGVARWCWDAMGHKTDDVYQVSRETNPFWVIPIQGANKYGKPIADMPRKRNRAKVYLTTVGTDNAKARLYDRLTIMPSADGSPVPGCVHFPLDDDLAGDEFFKQLCSATKKMEISKRDGRRVWRWVKVNHPFDEALDGYVYALAALNIEYRRFGFQFAEEAAPATRAGNKPTIAELAQRINGSTA